MARNLENQTNVTAPSADYPNGRIKNDTGVGDGTPISEQLYGDIHQFFMKALRDAGITPNDLPDNETNGYQLATALYNVMPEKSFKLGWINTGLTVDGAVTENEAIQYRIIGSVASGEYFVQWRGKITITSAAAATVLTMPADARPNNRLNEACAIKSSQQGTAFFEIDTAGNMKINLGSAGNVSGNEISLDSLGYWVR